MSIRGHRGRCARLPAAHRVPRRAWAGRAPRPCRSVPRRERPWPRRHLRRALHRARGRRGAGRSRPGRRGSGRRCASQRGSGLRRVHQKIWANQGKITWPAIANTPACSDTSPCTSAAHREFRAACPVRARPRRQSPPAARHRRPWRSTAGRPAYRRDQGPQAG